MAGLLADGVADLLGSLRGPRQLRLAGLPLGDPTARALAARLPDGVLATVRSRGLVDDLDDVGAGRPQPRPARCWSGGCPACWPREPDPRARDFLRAAARLHAAIGQLELAVVADGDASGPALLTLVDGADRWPWWGFGDGGPLRTELGCARWWA